MSSMTRLRSWSYPLSVPVTGSEAVVSWGARWSGRALAFASTGEFNAHSLVDVFREVQDRLLLRTILARARCATARCWTASRGSSRSTAASLRKKRRSA